MCRRLVLVLFVLAATVGGPLWSADQAAPAGKVTGGREPVFPPWFKDSFLEIAADVDEATAAGKHVLLFFHIANCPYCYKMLEENFKGSPYTDFLQARFDSIAIDVLGDREIAFNESLTVTEKTLARHLNVLYTPTILFLDPGNRTVLRLNGYRSVQAFKYALDFVDTRAYERTTLAQYIEALEPAPVYHLRQHPSFSETTDLHTASDGPLAVIFEDQTCDECDALHDGILSRPETLAILERFTVVRLDALSSEPITDLTGNHTTPKAFAATLGISYRPGIVLFDRGREITRITGMLRTFHFQQVLRYVGERHYERYPDLREFRRADRSAILRSGRDIDIWE